MTTSQIRDHPVHRDLPRRRAFHAGYGAWGRTAGVIAGPHTRM